MLCHIKVQLKVSVVALLAFSTGALALEPCGPGLKSIDVRQGEFVKAPGYISPDTESQNLDGSLKEQGWHNLRKAVRPLNIICRYKGKESTTVTLPIAIDTCVYTPGHIVCE